MDQANDAPRPHILERTKRVSWIGKVGHALSELVMPPVCLSCHDPVDVHDRLCPPCWATIDFIRAPLCDRLGLTMPFDTGDTMISAAAVAADPVYGRARAVAQYSGNMRKLIHDYKYRDRHDARTLFVNWMAIAGHDLLTDADLVVPVPLHRWRVLTRRFNQSALMARDLGKAYRCIYAHDTLRRVRRTNPQGGLSQAHRREYQAGAFSVKPSHRRLLAGKRVLLIDDVITTGSTANACAKVLKKAGASHVDVLALALVADSARIPT